jgi:hypothetical protein
MQLGCIGIGGRLAIGLVSAARRFPQRAGFRRAPVPAACR